MKFIFLTFCFIVMGFFCNYLHAEENQIEQQDLISINELCIIPHEREYPKWIELKSFSNQDTNLKGWSLYDRKRCFYKFDNNFIIPPAKFVLLIFYHGNKISKKFELSLPKNIQKLNIFKCVPYLSSDDTIITGKFYGVKSKSELIKYFDNQMKKMPDWAFDGYKQIPDAIKPEFKDKAVHFLKKHKISEKKEYIKIVMGDYWLNCFLADEIALFNSENKLVSYVSWGDKYSTANYKNALIVGIWKYSRDIQYVNRKNHYAYLHRFRNQQSSPIMSETDFEISPGCAQNRKPFSDINMDTTSDIKHDKEKEWIFQVNFTAVNGTIPAKWGYEFQITADQEFKKLLYKQNEKVKSRTSFAHRLYFKLTKKQFKNLLWNPELYYRIRRILPDGYKTEWAGGECGKAFQEAYKHHKDYKAAMADKKLWDKVGLLEEKRRNLRKKNEDLRKSLKKTNNKEKIADLNKKIEDNLKQIEKLSVEIKACYKKMRELKKKNK